MLSYFRRDGSLLVVAAGLGFAACAAASSKPQAASGLDVLAAEPPAQADKPGAKAKDSAKSKPKPVASPKGSLNLEQARQYVLKLVNRDRAEQGLPPVVMDEAANRAGQRHAEDMARAGYTAHWGTDGSVPEQRYSEAGGTDFVQENAGCLADGKERKLDAEPRFEPAHLERVQHAFMDEKPPRDGHRRNILKPGHSALGVGIARPSGVDLACLSQEFVDDYGDYEALPKTARAGSVLHVEGEVKGSITFGGVGIGRIDLPRPFTAAHLNTTYTYAVPSPTDLYFPKGFVTKKPVEVKGKHFSIDVPLGKAGQPGRYGVSIWGKFPGAGQQLDMVSLRVITVP